MKRTAMAFLNEWLISSNRKPLVIRGARQVGKTWLVRNLAATHNLKLIEVNLENRPEIASLLTSNNPQEMLLVLSSVLRQDIDPQKSLLFFDEVQTAPIIIAKLRWFAEEMPQLPVIVTGSLLEFALATFKFSMPVGRINYMYLEPLSFVEFLWATEHSQLAEYLNHYTFATEIPVPIHDMLMGIFKEYVIIGGMPEAVDNWSKNRSLSAVSQIHQDIIGTYRDDFNKYAGRIPPERLDEVLLAVPKNIGHKFVYSSVNPHVAVPSIKQALDLLDKAKVCHKIYATDANGLPLGAELNKKFLKVILLDTGLCSSALGLSLDRLSSIDELSLVNKGGIAEQVVGQLLRTINPFYVEPKLYYWQRSEKGADAEVDYIIQHKNVVMPVEVKAGSAGAMKSLHYFMGVRNYSQAVRINSALPLILPINVKDQQGNPASYTLYSIPFYLVSELHRLLP